MGMYVAAAATSFGRCLAYQYTWFRTLNGCDWTPVISKSLRASTVLRIFSRASVQRSSRPVPTMHSMSPSSSIHVPSLPHVSIPKLANSISSCAASACSPCLTP